MFSPTCPACPPTGAAETAARHESASAFFADLFATADFPPRWRCGSWPAEVGWLHVGSDCLIFAAYLAIPLGLLGVMAWRAKRAGGTLVQKWRAAVPFPKLTVAFAAFVLMCGVGHLLEAVIFWHPVYRFAGLWKALTAVVSVGTAIALLRTAPRLLALPDAARAGAELRDQTALLRGVIDASPHATFWKDTDGRYLGCNGVFPQYVGQDDEAGVVGKTDLDFGMDREDAMHFRAVDRRVMDGGEPVLNFEEQIDLRGDRRDLSTSKVPLRDAGGAVRGVVGVFADVTDRKRAERDLKNSLLELADSHAEVEKLSLLASTNRHAVLINSPDTAIEWVNEAFTRQTGYSAEEAVGRKPDFLLSPDADPATLAEIDAALAAGRPVSAEVLQRTKDGHDYWIALEIEHALDDAGNLTRFVATQTAIGDRKAAEAQRLQDLAEIEKLGLVARATRHSVIIADARGRVEWVNDAFTALTKYTLEDVLGEKPGDVLQGPDTCPETKLRIGAQLRRGEAVSEEIINYCKEGDGYPIRLEIEPVKNDAGEIVNFVAIQVDLRERKAQEAALLEAKDAAEAANRTKSAFLANMSHEIRTPLNGILGFADVLRAGGATAEETGEYLDTIRSSGDHLLGLINDILDLSKVEAGKMEFEPVRCDPHAVIAAVLSSLRVKAVEKGLTLECRWAGAAPETIVTDPGRLRQLLTNLVGNAIKFTESGSVRLMAALEDDPDGAGPRFVVEVHDTGEGVAADKLEAIFEPFAQADASVTRRHGGTGLGLAIGRKVAEGLGGTLSATSRVGWGSVFRLSVHPGDMRGVATREAVSGDSVNDFPGEPSAQSATPAAGPAAVRADARVLLVEDGEVNRRLIRVVLERAGVTPAEAVDGRAGVDAALAAAAAGDPFELILMDMQMPVLDGYAAAAELRAAGFDAPVVALTAHAMDGDRDRCLAAGCTDYLTKPVRPADLLAKLAEHLPAGADPEEPGPAPADPVVCTLGPEDADLRGLAAEFAASLPGRLAECRDALAAGDRGGLETAAHKWKGAGGTLGFDPFTAPADRLERAAPDADDAALEELMDELAALTARVRTGGPAGEPAGVA